MRAQVSRFGCQLSNHTDHGPEMSHKEPHQRFSSTSKEIKNISNQIKVKTVRSEVCITQLQARE